MCRESIKLPERADLLDQWQVADADVDLVGDAVVFRVHGEHNFFSCFIENLKQKQKQCFFFFMDLFIDSSHSDSCLQPPLFLSSGLFHVHSDIYVTDRQTSRHSAFCFCLLKWTETLSGGFDQLVQAAAEFHRSL